MSDTFSSTHPLLSVAHWDTQTISYSFYNNANGGSYYGDETGVSEISEETKDNIRSIFETLERYLDVDFHEVPDTTTDYGLLRYMVSDGPGYSYAYLPEGFNFNFGNGWDVAGDVHLNPAYDTTGKNGNGFADDPGNHGYMTLIHETLHALGFKHPNKYEDHDHGPFLPFNEDNTTNTVMSYNFAGKSAITPMIYDIQALQLIYGAREYNHGDTTYSFDSVYYYTDGSEDYGATKPIKQTLWDSGGENTLDFSNLAFLNTGYHFDMNEGGIITTQNAYNGSSYKARTDDSGTKYLTSESGTAIAFDTIFHNLINSSSNDYIIANSAANIFSGYELGISTGDDIIEGWNYLDTLDLSEYASSSVTQTQEGYDLILDLGWDSSITLKDYYAVSQSDRLNITFEEDSQPPVWEEIIIPDTITNISDVQYVAEEPQPTNTAPTDITLDGRSVKEFSKNGTTIAKLTTKDVDSGDSHTYKLLDDAQGRFKIDGNRLKVKNGHLIDFDDNSSHSIKIRTTDSGGKSYDKTFTIEVLNQNFAPTDITLDGRSVKEFSKNGTTIAKLTTKDVDSGDSHTYKLLDDAQGRFKIVDDQLKVKNGTLLDFDINSSHPIKIRTTDQGGESYEKTFTIEVLNQNWKSKSIRGDRYDNRLEGGHGDDRLWGNGNNDTLIGGSGHDTLSGGSEDDTLVGGSGNDFLRGTWGNDNLYGGYNDDTLGGGQGDDYLFGGVGNDRIMGDVGNDTLEGSSGQDTLSGGSGDDLIEAGTEDDTLRGGEGNDTLKGGSGNDYLRGDQGNDSLEGGSGNDYLIGASGNDSLDGGSDHDTLKGSSGNNYLIGGSGDDLLDGGRNHDSLEGGSGNDYLIGGLGDDLLDGGQHHDFLKGGSGNDSLIGGSGNDTLNGVGNGSRGNGEIDVLVGGAWSDTFILGDDHRAFYQGKGDNDYAEIYDLESKDIIQLYGVADQYDLVDADNGLPGSTALYFKNDLIAVLHDVSVSDVSSRLEFLS
ncbi:MAG: hypothetical protein F6K50_12235 [Moorea sp. SIO3I7]|uniref:hypothetical protein n=1 Tax=unclassified Moorena TaxID=2683338 RepID=UPI0013C9069C|nr:MULTISPECIES: hypothetical protein [unclassified Moorena]NEN96274.1 hypothetical protein [Moorena sp. SIO3I7]NEO22023.1 hypothetical protein [Moorena sp. SIO4A5]NEP23615.1 hypothetical protein [Moorena sp. SIO3I6]NEQ59555.1 hypothetical protein [Moorena sp. SIO4A1]